MKKYFKYKGITVNPFGIPVFHSEKDDIKKNGKSRKRYLQYRCFNFNFANNTPKNLLVMYDIPSDKKKERDWFRRQLKNFNYIMIQKSVWVGPSPLPKDFLDYIKSIGLTNQLVTLKLAKPYSKGDKNM